MTEETLCERICNAIEDEREGQLEYIALAKELNQEASPEEAYAVEKLIVTDEKKHEEYMKVLDQSHMCNCK